MSPLPAPPPAPDRLTCYYRSGAAMRSRGVSERLLCATLDLPRPPARLLADWEREIALHLGLEPGDVEPLPLVRARARWPAYRHCMQAMAEWTRGLGLGELLASSEMALMACRGAREHDDAARYGAAAFCNLFVSDDKGLDLHFPGSGQRLPLVRGTAVIFDTGQTHAVIPRHRSAFDAADFARGRDVSQVFLTWELPIEHPAVAQALGIAFDTDPATAARLQEAQVRPTPARPGR